VPRQRTRLLARASVRLARAQPAPVVLELFCGVAPIAAIVARAIPGAEVHAADIDPAALAHARRNLPRAASAHQADRFDGLPAALRGRLTVIAAVPPYVPATEAHLMPRDDLVHEPARALIAGSDGLEQVRAVVDSARRPYHTHRRVS